MQPHPILAFGLDIADKLLKLAAVVLGGIWTYWNYRKSRTYAQKLELQLAASILVRMETYLEIRATIKNLGGSAHTVQHAGSLCSIYAVDENITERRIRVLPVFNSEDQIEPGESISDLILLKLNAEDAASVWIQIDLRVISGSVEWHKREIVRLERRPGKGTQGAIDEIHL